MGNPLGIHMKPAERKKQAITDLERKREHMLLDQRVIGHVTSHQSSPDYRISARRVNFRWQRGTKIGNTRFLWIWIETCVFVFLWTVKFKLGHTFEPQRDRYFIVIYIELHL